MSRTTSRRQFRVMTRRRGGYDGATMHDVQLKVAATGAMVWAQTFTDQRQALEFEEQVEHDLDDLDPEGFRRKYGVPSTA